MRRALAGKLVISIAAGIRVPTLQRWLPDTAIIRAMPNTPCLIGEGMTVLAPADDVSEARRAFAREIFESVGRCLELEDKHMDAVTSLNGSGPAFAYVMLEALAEDRDPERQGNAARTHAPQGCYPCLGDDRWCVIAIRDQAAWERLCIITGNQQWRHDPRFADVEARIANAAELDTLISGWTELHDRYDVMHQLARAGIAAGVVQDVEDQLERDPHLEARGYFERIFHHAKGMVLAPGIPLGLSGTPGRTRLLQPSFRPVSLSNQTYTTGVMKSVRSCDTMRPPTTEMPRG